MQIRLYFKSRELSIPCPMNANHDFIYYSMLFFAFIIILNAPRGNLFVVSAMLSQFAYMYEVRPKRIL